MLNNKFRKESIEKLQKSIQDYNTTNEKMVDKAGRLYEVRSSLKENLDNVFHFVNGIRNTPEEIDMEIEKVEFNLTNYDELLDSAKLELRKADNLTKGGAAASVAAGIGVAAIAPTAAMGIATTFGAASTGTAIASLSGAAATNAALAWLGGGALATGGAGIAGGSAILALAGPIGWSVAGVGLLSSGLFKNGKNKKIAYDAIQEKLEIESHTKMQHLVILEIENLIKLTEKDATNLQNRLVMAKEYPSSYLDMSSHQKLLLGTLVNNALSASKRINQIVGESKKETLEDMKLADNIQNSVEDVVNETTVLDLQKETNFAYPWSEAQKALYCTNNLAEAVDYLKFNFSNQIE